MPLYDYKCLKCGKECLLALTLKEHENGAATCPSCGKQRTRTIDYQLYCQNQFKKLAQGTYRLRVTSKSLRIKNWPTNPRLATHTFIF